MFGDISSGMAWLCEQVNIKDAGGLESCALIPSHIQESSAGARQLIGVVELDGTPGI